MCILRLVHHDTLCTTRRFPFRQGHHHPKSSSVTEGSLSPYLAGAVVSASLATFQLLLSTRWRHQHSSCISGMRCHGISPSAQFLCTRFQMPPPQSQCSQLCRRKSSLFLRPSQCHTWHVKKVVIALATLLPIALGLSSRLHWSFGLRRCYFHHISSGVLVARWNGSF
jgi:hypothetical protein